MNAPLAVDDAIRAHGERAVRQAAQHACWGMGDLSFLLHEGQRALLAAFEATLVVIQVWNIGRRYGKSTAACTMACEKALKKKGARILYLASTHKSLVDNVIPMFEAISATAPEHLRPRIVGDNVLFTNGSKILLYGVEDRLKANRIRGGKADLVIVDEAGFIGVLGYVVEDILTPQLINTGGKMLLCSTPPETMAHDFTRFAENAERLGAYTRLTVYDAPHLTRAQIARLAESFGGEESTKWRREFCAEFVVDPINQLVPEFSQYESTIVTAHPRPFEYDRYTVGDIGFVDLTAFLFASYDFPNAILYVEDEYFAEKATSRSISTALAEKEATVWPEPLAPFARHEVWVDAQTITRADLGDTSNRYHRAVNTKEPEEAINKLRVSIAGHIRIHPRCKNLIAHLRHGIWNEQRTSFARSEGLGHFDGVAALMYLWRHVDRNHNPQTPFIQSVVTHFVPKEKQVQYFASEAAKNASQLADIFKPRRRRA